MPTIIDSVISNRDDIIDSRDVIREIEELESIVEDGVALEEDREKLKALIQLAEEGEGSPDWRYGEALIRDSYFQEYARQLADDIGAINPDAKWPNNCIDWERAARELQVDYFSVDFQGVTYWIRG